MFEPKKVFISGPMSGYPDWNKPAFMRAESELKAAGFSVFNPAWLNVDEHWTNQDLMAIDLAALSRCDYIYQLEGWENSKGARAEYMAAVWSGCEIVNHSWLEFYVKERQKFNKDFDRRFEENRQKWKEAAKEHGRSIIEQKERELESLKEVKLNDEKEIEKGVYESARPSD